MSQTLVVMNDIRKVFQKESVEVVALDGIDLEIQEGDFISLMGPSGSGKSTLLNLIAGIDRPSSGEMRILDADFRHMSEDDMASWRNEHVGFIFQHFNLIPVLTAFENVELPLLLTRLSKAERREHVETALSLVGLSDRLEHYPRQLSGGQEQRVAIARAIVTDPTLILADEPTGDLDARAAGEILDLMQRLNEEYHKTIIMVTHDPTAADRATSLLHLEKGVLVEATSDVGNEG